MKRFLDPPMRWLDRFRISEICRRFSRYGRSWSCSDHSCLPSWRLGFPRCGNSDDRKYKLEGFQVSGFLDFYFFWISTFLDFGFFWIFTFLDFWVSGFLLFLDLYFSGFLVSWVSTFLDLGSLGLLVFRLSTFLDFWISGFLLFWMSAFRSLCFW